MAEQTRRGGIEPPDLSEEGGLKHGVQQRSDERLFMQLFVFGGCSSVLAAASDLADVPIETVLYEDLNDPLGIGVLALARDPNAFIDTLRPALK